ncbi:MAG TPA: shikimate dehydrogenase [Streptosporangiaceae bacterium]|jgi:shikimate dehydrogenase
MSRLVGLIGSDIRTSLSPALHEREAGHHGLSLCYRIIDLVDLGMPVDAVGDLLGWARRLGFDGLNITHPCKAAVIPHLDALSDDARALGAVNTVVFDDGRAIGHNTDWTGFDAAFTRGFADAPVGHVVLLGAGGAGSAVAHALLTRGAGRLTVADLDPARADVLTGALALRFGADRVRRAGLAELGEALAEADGLVHATPVGMSNSPGMPVPAALLNPELWVADIVYRPLRTELLRRAGERGCRTLNGGGMVVYQAAHAFRLFTGAEPDTERMFAHLTGLVTP